MKKKLKFIAVLLALCALTFIFTGCKQGGSDSESGTTAVNANVTMNVETVAEALSKVKYVEEMAKLKTDVVSATYSFTAGSENVVVYGASGATPEEIIVAEYKNAETAKSALTKYEDHCSDKKKTFDTYNSQYRYQLDKMILQQVGKYIIYCVSDDYDAAVKVLDSYIK